MGQPRIYGKSLANKSRRPAASHAPDGPPCACGCGKPLPPMAVRHGDPYASTVCFKRAHGLISAEDAASQERKHVNTSGERAYSSQAGPYQGEETA